MIRGFPSFDSKFNFVLGTKSSTDMSKWFFPLRCRRRRPPHPPPILPPSSLTRKKEEKKEEHDQKQTKTANYFTRIR